MYTLASVIEETDFEKYNLYEAADWRVGII